MKAESFFLKFVLWLTILTTIFQLAVQQLTPEGIRYAEIRCRDDSQNAAERLKALWTQRIYPNDKHTYCYINCFLHKLGLIDLNTRGVNLDSFVQVLEKTETSTNDVCTDLLYTHEPLDGTCYSYYNKWINFTKHCSEVVNLVMQDQKNGLIKLDDNLPRWKDRNETASHFCDTELARSDANVAAEVSDTADNSFAASYKCNLECLFRHFHYFDAYGRLDESEICRSFKDVHLLTSQNTATIHHCTHRGNSLYSSGFCEMAYELNSCMQKKSGKDYFKAYQNRDKITQQF